MYESTESDILVIHQINITPQVLYVEYLIQLICFLSVKYPTARIESIPALAIVFGPADLDVNQIR
jgi:hypothetical protein